MKEMHVHPNRDISAMIRVVLLLCAVTLSTSTHAAVSVSSATDEGLDCFKIETETATYFFDKVGGGFTSVLDKDDNDWINYHQQPCGYPAGLGGCYRGIPNMVWQVNGQNFFHPGHSGGQGSTTTLEVEEENHVQLKCVSANSAWECTWDFYPTHAQQDVTKTNGNYWWLYEGTAGSAVEASSDYYFMPDGTKKTQSSALSGDIPDKEWLAFGDPGIDRVFAVMHHDDDQAADCMSIYNNVMIVMGFGRSGTGKGLNGPNKFSIAFVEATDHPTIKTTVEAILDGTVDTRTPAPVVYASHRAFSIGRASGMAPVLRMHSDEAYTLSLFSPRGRRIAILSGDNGGTCGLSGLEGYAGTVVIKGRIGNRSVSHSCVLR